MNVDFKETADFLRERDNFYILTHQNPDGDTIGSGFGLCHALRKMGKRANVLCSDEFPRRYGFMYGGCEPEKFSPETFIAVDVADKKLLGAGLVGYGDYIDLCVDHHVSNMKYAERLLLRPDAAATCEIMYRVILELDPALMDERIAECLYTGIATDTGCFKYSNTTRESHIAAAELMGYGINAARINREMFDIKSKARIKVEQYIYSSMEFYLDDKCAMAAVTLDTMRKAGLAPEEFEGISGMSVQPEGVQVGVIIREKEEGRFKVSMRSASDVDVSAVCKKLGGGGHAKAAGCNLEGDLSDVKLKLLSAIASAMGIDLWLA